MAKRKTKASTYLINEPNWKELALVQTEEEKIKAYQSCNYFVHQEIQSKTLQNHMKDWIKLSSGWDKKDIKAILTIPDAFFSTSGKYAFIFKKLGWMPNDILNYINDTKKLEWLERAKKVIEEKQEKQANKRVISIQDRMREQVSSLCGEWEAKLDTFVESKNFDIKSFDPYNQMRAHSPAVKPAHAKIIKEMFSSEIQEAKELVEWQDPDIKEAYSHFDSSMRKSFLEFFNKIESACNTLIQTGKAQRKPRKPKAISKEKLVSKLKYQLNDSDLGIASINPVDIIDASEVWVYNTKNRKIGVYKKSITSPGLTVKGTSIIDFSEDLSIQKTLRKPAEQLKLFSGNAKTKLQSAFDDIKATEIKLNGRINDSIIILKSF